MAAAIIEVRAGRVVGCGIVRTPSELAGAVVEQGVGLVVVRRGVRASVAIVGAGAVVFGGCRIEVAGVGLVAALQFVEVADAVKVFVADAGSVTLVAIVGVPAGAVVVRGVGAVVARGLVHAAGDLVLVAHPIAVGVVQARALAVHVVRTEEVFGEQAVVVVGIGRAGVVVAGRLQLATALRLAPAEGLELHVVAVAVREDLNVHLAAEHTVGGELTEQDAKVISSEAVGGPVQGEPATAVVAAEFDVAAGFEGRDPGLTLDEGHLPFSSSSVGRAGQAHRHPAVVGHLREGVDDHGVDGVGVGRTERILMEGRAGADEGRVGRIAGHGAEEVPGIFECDVHLIGGHAVHAAFDRVDVQGVGSRGGVHAVTGAEVTGTVVRRGLVVVVARECIHATERLEDGDGLRGRGGIAAGVHCSEGPGHGLEVIGRRVGGVLAQHRGGAAVVRSFRHRVGQGVVHADGDIGRHTREHRGHRVDDLNGLDMLGGVATGVGRSEGADQGGFPCTFAFLGFLGHRDGHVAAIVRRLDGGGREGGVARHGGVRRGDSDGRRSEVGHGDHLNADGLIAAGVFHAPRAGDVLAHAGVHVEELRIVVGHRVVVAILGDGHVTRRSRAEVGAACDREVGGRLEHRGIVVNDGQRPGRRGGVARSVGHGVGPRDHRGARVTGGGLLEGDGEVGTSVFRRDVRAGELVLAAEGQVRREVHKRGRRGVHMGTEGEHHQVTEALGLAVGKHLHVELAARLTVRGQLGEEDTLVVSGHAVGVVAGHVPGSTEESIDGEVLSGFKSSGPAFAGRFSQSHAGLASGQVRLLVDADRQPAVVLEGRERLKEHRVDGVGEQAAQVVLIERSGRAEARGRLGIAAHGTHDIGRVGCRDVVAVGRHAGDAVDGHDLLDEGVVRIAGGDVGTAVGTRTVVIGRPGAVVARGGVGTAGHFLAVADAVAVGVGEAVAITIEVIDGRISAKCWIGRGARREVACRGVVAPDAQCTGRGNESITIPSVRDMESGRSGRPREFVEVVIVIGFPMANRDGRVHSADAHRGFPKLGVIVSGLIPRSNDRELGQTVHGELQPTTCSR